MHDLFAKPPTKITIYAMPSTVSTSKHSSYVTKNGVFSVTLLDTLGLIIEIKQTPNCYKIKSSSV